MHLDGQREMILADEWFGQVVPNGADYLFTHEDGTRYGQFRTVPFGAIVNLKLEDVQVIG